MRWNDVVDGYFLARSRELAENTRKGYRIVFARFGEYIHDADIGKITVRQVNAYLTYEQDVRELAPKSVLNIWIALSSLWSWAHAELGIRQIMADVSKPKANPRMQQPLTEEEVRRLLDGCEAMRAWDRRNNRHTNGARPTALRDVAMVMVLLDTGLRASELCDARLADYDRKQGRLIVEHGKGDKQRAVFLGTAAQRALWRYLASREDVQATDPLFATDTGHALERVGLQKILRRAGERAGVANVAPHRLRHTFAINFLRNGGNLFALQAMLGHSSLEMVRRYARLAEVDLAAAQRKASPADKWRL